MQVAKPSREGCLPCSEVTFCGDGCFPSAEYLPPTTRTVIEIHYKNCDLLIRTRNCGSSLPQMHFASSLCIDVAYRIVRSPVLPKISRVNIVLKREGKALMFMI